MSHGSFVYLDDGFGSQPDQCSAAAAAVIQERELSSSGFLVNEDKAHCCLLYTSPSPRDGLLSRMPSSA